MSFEIYCVVETGQIYFTDGNIHFTTHSKNSNSPHFHQPWKPHVAADNNTTNPIVFWFGHTKIALALYCEPHRLSLTGKLDRALTRFHKTAGRSLWPLEKIVNDGFTYRRSMRCGTRMFYWCGIAERVNGNDSGCCLKSVFAFQTFWYVWNVSHVGIYEQCKQLNKQLLLI